jgi:hypothetical protein
LIDPLERADGVIDSLDKYLMLAIQSVCNNRGIKIPWDLVADTMGPPITEGAVVQHLAKLRQRMEDSGQPVPPPLRRGGAVPITKVTRGVGAGSMMTGTPGSAGKGTKRKVQATNDNLEEDDEEYGNAVGMKNEYGGGSSKKRGKATSSKKAIKAEDSDDYEDAPVNKGRVKVKKQKHSSDDDDDDFKDSAAWSAKPTITRERKSSINYAEPKGEGSGSGTEAGDIGDSEDEKKYPVSGAAILSRGNGQPYNELASPRRNQSKVIVLPVCLPIHSSENPLGIQVVKDKDEDSDYEVDSLPSSEVGSIGGGIKDSRAYDNDSFNLAQQPNSRRAPSFDSPARRPEQVSNQLQRNQLTFARPVSASDFQRNQGYDTGSGNHHSFAGPMLPSIEPMPMGPPVASNNARHTLSSLGNGMRIDTNLANSSYSTTANNSYSSNSTAANNSRSSMNPSPNSTTAQSPLDMSFQQGVPYGNGYVGGEGEFQDPFLSSSLVDPTDHTWMEELFPGAGFGNGSGGSGMGDFDAFI